MPLSLNIIFYDNQKIIIFTQPRQENINLLINIKKIKRMFIILIILIIFLLIIFVLIVLNFTISFSFSKVRNCDSEPVFANKTSGSFLFQVNKKIEYEK